MHCGKHNFRLRVKGADRVYIHVVGTGFDEDDKFSLTFRSGAIRLNPFGIVSALLQILAVISWFW
ncbi:hypothetical protein FGIG_03275 [Fasciola gigantica]|uniref:Uncharacterized protein n=1 Tax=Fasciola gigantica TaxID=46835 RepID=A0A504YEX9_FASGI|nr:hypothetical protein FGIG_03275 [Fasciola gigantica]